VNTVAVLGSKGGTGKSSLSHCLAYGACLAGLDAVMVHTDQRPLVKGRRPYACIDASANYAQVPALIRERQERSGMIVIDGAGNRPHVDLWVARTVDLVLIPVTNSEEDVRCALHDLARLANPKVHVVVNRWPANRLVRLVAQRYVDKLPETRVAGKLPEVGAMRHLLDYGDWQTPCTKVNNQARRLYRLVNGMLHAVPMHAEAETQQRVAL
jgi:CO dehydrogenase nickel-insertion accessory protein CooC1